MRVNQAGVDLIKSFETLQLKAYKPTSNDVWTIGYGHTGGVKAGESINAAKAEELLEDDLAHFEEGVSRNLGGAQTSANEFSAMVALAFNIGLGGFLASSVLRFHREGHKAKAAQSFLLWNKQRQANGKMEILPGLTRRREAERDLYLQADV
jgi:lysozyme